MGWKSLDGMPVFGQTLEHCGNRKLFLTWDETKNIVMYTQLKVGARGK